MCADRRQRDRLLRWAAPFEPRLWAIEGATGHGALLAQQLVASGETVVDVPAALSARARLLDAGRKDKTDAHDARSAAIVALRHRNLREVGLEDHRQMLRLLARRHHQLTATDARRHRRSTQLLDRRERMLVLALETAPRRGWVAIDKNRVKGRHHDRRSTVYALAPLLAPCRVAMPTRSTSVDRTS